ncbi:hypothetical protein TSUD_26760 [Trifolium subterraneum]|uniref:Uncharacterized protein n=1 Tax=Trifolium subterraneum TaxID=3900 RepID=A0A2Z6LKB3_TRISU|nr:hypothetical protein TSUD_26760 [Trifolium subterraneum]
MVLLRELDGAKDYPLLIHHVGSNWERQVRAHYTRADGTLNINGYYSDMFGFTVKSSDFESGSSDSDSDSSGNDSDCVIISSSEFSSKNPNNRSLIVVDSVATISTSMEISSRFTTDEFVSTFRQAVQVSGEGGENRVMIDPVALGKFVNTVNELEPHYFYMDTFVRFRCGEGFPELMFDVSRDRLFPFYWSSSPRLIKGTRISTLNEYEWLAVSIFSRSQVSSSAELISKVNKPQSLGEYLDAMSQLVVEEGGVKNTKRKNPEESGRIPIEIPKKRKSTVVDEEEAEIEDEPLKTRRMPKGGSSAANKGKGASSHCCPSNPEARKGKKSNLSASLFTKDFDSSGLVDDGFQKYARTSSLSGLTFVELRQAAVDHHIQGALLTYYLSNRQELESIDFRNKMESVDTSLSALEKEFTAAKSKFEEDLAAVKAEQEEKVKAAVKAKEDEVVALKGKVKTLEGELTEEKAKAKTQQEEASLNIVVLTAWMEKLEIEGAIQFDDEFRFALDQVKVAFPDVDVVKLGKLDSVNQIVEGKIVPYMPPTSNIMEKSSKKQHSAPTRRNPRVKSSQLLSSKPKASKKTSSSKVKNSKKPKREVIVIESSESDKADSYYVEYLKTYRPKDESWDSDPEESQLTAESKLISGKKKNSPCNKEG